MNSRRSMACSVREGLGKGYLTVFLTLILTVMLSFSMTLIECRGKYPPVCGRVCDGYRDEQHSGRISQGAAGAI